jgi:hypothetical protein
LPDNYKPYVKLKAGHQTLGRLLEKGQTNLVKKLCLDIITVSSFEQSPNGQPDNKILQAQTESLFNELKGKYLTLTPPELKECFRLGIRGESGPYFGLCPKTYAQFLKWWFDKDERLKAWTKYIDLVNGFTRAEKPSLAPEWFYEACEKAFIRYKEKGDLPVSPFGYYDFIKQYLGAETLIDKEKWPQIRNEANIEYRAKVKGLEIAKEWTLDPEVNLVYGNCIKNIAVKYFFDKLILEGKETIK